MNSVTQGSLEICIAVPTLGKSPFLPRLLLELENQVRTVSVKRGIKLYLLVIDNDPSFNTRTLVENFKLFCYVEEFVKGYATSRNRILERAQGCDFVVMIDDDMRLSEKWLEGVLHSIRSREAQIYSSPVIPDDIPAIPPWLRRYFIRPTRAAGRTSPDFGTGNVVIDLKFVESNSISFNLKFNKCSGEDLDFFDQMRACSAVANWSLSFPVYENHVRSQLTFRSVARREIRTAKAYEIFLADNSIRHSIHLVARLTEIAIFDWASLKMAVSNSEKFKLKTKLYFCYRLISFFKTLARLNVLIKRL
jgi:glycosyltransferase involved in cell wall biosynthesis